MKISQQIIGLVLILLLTYGMAGLGAWGMGDGLDTWYPLAEKPFFNPPDWVFGPVWSFLYTAMAVAAWRVWRLGWDTDGVKPALVLYSMQLILNALWSAIFFGWGLPGWALVEILALECVIILTYIHFRRLDDWAGYLFVPYILWVGFASLLNGAIWWLNV